MRMVRSIARGRGRIRDRYLATFASALEFLTFLLRGGPPFVEEGRKVMDVNPLRAFL